MTKKDITKTVAEKHSLTAVQAKAVTATFIEAITDAIFSEGRLELRGFGTFELKQRKGRMGRNPKTGAPVTIADKTTLKFRAGRILADRAKGLKVEAASLPPG